MLILNIRPLPLSEAVAQRLGYMLTRMDDGTDGVSFMRIFDTGECAIHDIEASRPDRGFHYWMKPGHDGRFTGMLDVDGGSQDRAEQIDSFELAAAYARDLGNEGAALRCEEYRDRNLQAMRRNDPYAEGQRTAATGRNRDDNPYCDATQCARWTAWDDGFSREVGDVGFNSVDEASEFELAQIKAR